MAPYDPIPEIWMQVLWPHYMFFFPLPFVQIMYNQLNYGVLETVKDNQEEWEASKTTVQGGKKIRKEKN